MEYHRGNPANYQVCLSAGTKMEHKKATRVPVHHLNMDFLCVMHNSSFIHAGSFGKHTRGWISRHHGITPGSAGHRLSVFMDETRSHHPQLYTHPPTLLLSKYSKMVTMEFVVNLHSDDRFARPL